MGDLDRCEIPTRNDIQTTPHGTGGWPGLKDHQNKTDKFLTVFVVMCFIINSQKYKSKALKKHILKDIVPRGLDKRIEEIQGNHQQAITGRDNQINVVDFTNEKHQQKILRLNKEIDDLIAIRNVARHGCSDNVLYFIKKKKEKSSGDVQPNYFIRCQDRQLEKHN